jgi:hypothetical protein
MGEAGIDSFQELVEMNAILGCLKTNSILGQALPAGNSRRKKKHTLLEVGREGRDEGLVVA